MKPEILKATKTKVPQERKSEMYPFDELLLNESFDAGEYTKERSQKMGGVLGYYNRTRTNKKFVQRKMNGKLFIFRKK